jgi:hypothetical protein
MAGGWLPKICLAKTAEGKQLDVYTAEATAVWHIGEVYKRSGHGEREAWINRKTDNEVLTNNDWRACEIELDDEEQRSNSLGLLVVKSSPAAGSLPKN